MRFSVPTLPPSLGGQVPVALPIEIEPLVVGTPVRVRSQLETAALKPLSCPIPASIADILSGPRGSALGYHSVATSLECPTKKMLINLGVEPKRDRVYDADGVEVEPAFDGSGKINAKLYGSIVHALLAVRIVHGVEAAERILFVDGQYTPFSVALGAENAIRLLLILRLYDQAHPLSAEPFTYISVEQPISSDIGDGNGGSLVRTATYDAVVASREQRVVFSLEKKTSARGGSSAMDVYAGQFATQVTVWNSNPHLVKTYGPMAGVIPDVIVKTATPKIERHGVRYISKFVQHLATGYLRLPDQIMYPNGVANTPLGLPAYLHACWGRFDPCVYIPLCWEGSHGEFEQREHP